MDDSKNIADYHERFMNGRLNEAELAEFLLLLDNPTLQNSLNAALLDRWNKTSYESVLTVESRHRMASAIMEKYPLQAFDTRENANAINVTAHRVHFLRTAWFRYAAAIIILFGVGAYLYTSQQKKKHPSSAEAITKEIKNDVKPGRERAMLTLSDGSTIALDSAANGQIAVQQGSSVIKKDGNIVYDPNQVSSKEVVYNTMSTPRGGQYQLTLPDGTQVWLNAASSIIYPTAFIEKQRIVKITGEVYFEVKKNAAKPFIVQTYKDEIKVLGTQFNVNAYPDEPFMKTSLLAGSIQVKDKVLESGQAYIDGSVIKTNTAEDIAWKNGFFAFRKAGIKDVMRQLSRWYDVTVSYKNIVPGGEFTGKIGKDLTLAQVMRLLGKARVNFLIEGKTITILP